MHVNPTRLLRSKKLQLVKSYMKSKNRLKLIGFACALFSVAASAQAYECTPEAPPSAFYTFDSPSALLDDSVAANNGSGTSVTSVGGVNGNGLGTTNNSEITLANPPFNSREQLSISVWLKPSNLQSVEARFVSQATGIYAGDHYVMASAYNGSALRFRLKTNDVTTTLVSSTGLLQTGQWSHAAFTYDGTKMQIWHNGAVVASVAKRGQIDSPLDVPFAIAGQPAGAGLRPFAGAMDDLVFFDRALSDGNIANLANRRNNNCAIMQDGAIPISKPEVADPKVTAPELIVQEVLTPEVTAPEVPTPVVPEVPVNRVVTAVDGQWPANHNNDLPMGGVFYGNYEAGLYSGNNPIAVESSRRFRAERDGFINAVRYQNRTLSDAVIEGRCNPSAPDSVWCKCVDAGLDKYSCGYTLGNSYSVGNGGSIVIEVRADDGTENGFPSDQLLGRTRGEFVPMDNASQNYPILELESPVELEAGKVYHLVYRNLNPPGNCRLQGLNTSDAARCPRNQGAIGLNGTWFANNALDDDSDTYGPFRGSASLNLFRNNTNGPWSSRTNNLSWYEVRYSDNVWTGDSYAAYGSVAQGRQTVDGRQQARQLFTVRDATRDVNGLWLNFGHDYTKSASGAPLNISLKNDRGDNLATGKINYSPDCAARSDSGNSFNDRPEKHCRAWGYTTLSQPVSLIEGDTYSVVFSSAAGGAYFLSTYFALDYWGSESRNHWKDSRAQHSNNDGRTWTDWTTTYRERDLALLFTVVGMPNYLP